MYGNGVKPIELAEYTWSEVQLTVHGIRQKSEGIRDAMYVLYCMQTPENKRQPKESLMPLPLDEDPEEQALQERVMIRREYMILKQKLIEKELNGSRST